MRGLVFFFTRIYLSFVSTLPCVLCLGWILLTSDLILSSVGSLSFEPPSSLLPFFLLYLPNPYLYLISLFNPPPVFTLFRAATDASAVRLGNQRTLIQRVDAQKATWEILSSDRKDVNTRCDDAPRGISCAAGPDGPGQDWYAISSYLLLTHPQASDYRVDTLPGQPTNVNLTMHAG